jgi:HD-like signal output (HDOD) protein
MTDSKIEDALKGPQNLPTLPTVAMRILDLAKSPDWNPRTVADLISYDQALAARVLRLANSAFYGVPQRITTIAHAVARLGNYTIHSLVRGVVSRQLPGQDLGSLDHRLFSQYAYRAALCSRLIAQRVALPNLWDLFVAGLLHDIGYLIIGQHFTAEFEAVVQQCRSLAASGQTQSMSDLEIEIIGVSHCEVGARLIADWNLPDLFQVAAKHHERPADAPTPQDQQIAAIIALTEGINPMQDFVTGVNDGKMVLPPEVLGMLGLQAEDCVEIRHDLDVQVEKLEGIFDA